MTLYARGGTMGKPNRHIQLRKNYPFARLHRFTRKIIVELIISPSSVILPYRLISYAIPSSHTACVARSTKSACG